MPEWMAHVETPINRPYLFADVTVAITAENATVDIDRSRDRDVDRKTSHNTMTGMMRSTGTRHEITPFRCHGDSLETEEGDMTIASLGLPVEVSRDYTTDGIVLGPLLPSSQRD
jgi:hypothetical protein